MKLILQLIIFLFFQAVTIAQTDYDKQVEFFANDILKKLSSDKKKIAVIDFKNNDDDITQFTRLVAEDISSEFAILSSNGSKFEIVERNNLKAILTDLKLSSSRDEAKIAKELGKKAVADVLVTGMITLFGDNYRITLKVLDTDNGNIITASKGLVVKTSALEDLHKKIITKGSSYFKEPTESQSSSKVYNDQSFQISESNVNGWIDFENTSRYGFYVFASTDQAVLTRTAVKYDEIYVSGKTTEKLPALKPGIYYVCICMEKNSSQCAITKKVEVKAGSSAKVIIQ